jgi:hypothetical protein
MSSLSDEPSDAAPVMVPAPHLTLGQSRRMGLGAPIKQVPDHSLQRAELPLASLPAKGRDSMDSASLERIPNDPVASRLAIDLPLATVPVDPPSGVSEMRTPVPGVAHATSNDTGDGPRLDLPLARPSSPAPTPSVQRSAMSEAEAADDSMPAVPSAVQRVPDGGLPVSSASTAKPATPAFPSGPSGAVPNLASSALPLVSESAARYSSAVAARDGAISPLVGARPLRPTATAQRSVSANAPASEGTLVADPSLREDSALPLAMPSFVQRASEDGPDFHSSPEGGRELQVMRLADDGAHADSPAHGGREISARLPLAPSRVAMQRAAQADDDAAVEPVESPTDNGAPTVQGAWYDSISSGARSMASAAGSSAAGAAGSAIGSVASSLGSHAPVEMDMDELAGKLYDRIRSRLKTELLVDRERAGFLTDLR